MHAHLRFRKPEKNNFGLDSLSVRFARMHQWKRTFSSAHTRRHRHTPSTLAENHSTCLEGLPVATEEQKQAVNAVSASVQESCHCMHCNELLITVCLGH